MMPLPMGSLPAGTFDLKRHCLGLEEHDKTLKRVVGERYKANMESAEKLMDQY